MEDEELKKLDETIRINENKIKAMELINKQNKLLNNNVLNDSAMVPKKLAAMDVIKQINKAKITAIVNIFGLFIVLALVSLNYVVAVSLSGLFIIANVFMVFLGQKEKMRLVTTYNIELPKPFIQLRK